jgi:hypothetical protein
MMVFREYQRRLWDPSKNVFVFLFLKLFLKIWDDNKHGILFIKKQDCKLGLGDETREWHSHVYGPVGIFMFDLRGNRIDGNGVQVGAASSKVSA